MNVRRARLGAMFLLAGIILTACGGRTAQPPPQPAAVDRGVHAAVQLCDAGEGNSLVRTQVCFQRRLLMIITPTADTATELPLIDAAVKREGGYIAESCHIVMHWVGRNYALDHHVTLASLQSYLPRTNDPGCSAGFAHGLVSALGPAIRKLDPASVARACAGSQTRYQAYSCVHGLGHAYMRAYNEELPLALRMCGRLPQVDVVDCAQGAFHDYWFSLSRVDGTVQLGPSLRPRALCGRQPQVFVRACWYRAFMESPPEHALNTPSDLVAVCAGLRGLQREGCITGAAVTFNNAFPYRQLSGCTQLAADIRVACARGTATQDLVGSPLSAQVQLVEQCGKFGAERRGCIEWIAKALNVDTNGAFLGPGCAALPMADRAACRTGAASWRGPLETFS
jgi:hypothetical protein